MVIYHPKSPEIQDRSPNGSLGEVGALKERQETPGVLQLSVQLRRWGHPSAAQKMHG